MQNTKVVLSEVMMPSHTNPSGNVHGGNIMKIMDSTAYAAARKFARSNVVTARVDELEFLLPIMIGDLLTCTAEIVFVGKTSMEVAVHVDVEVLEQDSGPQRALSAFFTMVALDRNGRPMSVPRLELDTPEKKAAFEQGKIRYEQYRERKRQRKAAKLTGNSKVEEKKIAQEQK